MKLVQFLLIGSILFLVACQGGNTSLKKEIEKLEETVEQSSDVNDAVTLIGKYHEFISKNTDKTEENASFYQKSAALYLKMNKPLQAIDELETAIKTQFSAPQIPDIAIQLANIYAGKLKDNTTANAIYKAYVDNYPDHPAHDSIAVRVEQVVPLEMQLKGIRNNIFNKENQLIDRKMANKYIKMAEIMAMFYPNDETAINALHQAGETARTIQNFRKAIAIYDWILNAYPDHPKTAQAMFLKGFTYDNNLKDVEKAREIYERFLEKYPNDDFADDTEFLLSNLGKSDDEIIQSFEQ